MKPLFQSFQYFQIRFLASQDFSLRKISRFARNDRREIETTKPFHFDERQQCHFDERQRGEILTPVEKSP